MFEYASVKMKCVINVLMDLNLNGTGREFLTHKLTTKKNGEFQLYVHPTYTDVAAAMINHSNYLSVFFARIFFVLRLFFVPDRLSHIKSVATQHYG